MIHISTHSKPQRKDIFTHSHVIHITQPFYSHHTGQAAPSVKNWKILSEQSVTGHMLFLTAISIFGLGRRC